jgi:hypothetical protein
VRSYRIRFLPRMLTCNPHGFTYTQQSARLVLNGFPSFSRLCVRSSSDCSVFSLVSPLPSTDSAGRGTRPLFAGFFGTMELCDSPANVHVGLVASRLLRPIRSHQRNGCYRGLSASVRKVSNRACGL